MIDSLKHPLIEKIRNLKGSHQNIFTLENPIHLDWLMASKNPQYTIEFVLFGDNELLKSYKLPNKFLTKPSILHHVQGRKIPLLAYVVINFEIPMGDKIIVLDNIVDYGNIGSIVRNSYMMGIKNFLILNDFNIFHPKTIDSSRGLIFFSNIIIFNDFEKIFQYIDENNYHLIITNLKGAGLSKINNKKLGILLGNETHGYNPLWDNYNDKTWLTIAMEVNDQCDSINVAALAAIVVYFYSY
jgi:tRNA G18 (ribose-2'-O)-methylase SpoU